MSIDVVAPASDELTNIEIAAQALDAVTAAAWNNPEMAPVSVRARILLGRDGVHADDERSDGKHVGAPGAQTEVVVDMTALGFEDEIARPDELYARYGAPDCDPAWRP